MEGRTQTGMRCGFYYSNKDLSTRTQSIMAQNRRRTNKATVKKTKATKTATKTATTTPTTTSTTKVVNLTAYFQSSNNTVRGFVSEQNAVGGNAYEVLAS